MSTRNSTHQLWDVSRGYVFAGGSGVVYPRLPLVRHQSAPAGPATVAAEDNAAVLPAFLATGNAPQKQSAGQRAVKGQGVAATAFTLTRAATTIATSSAIAPKGADATVKVQTAVAAVDISVTTALASEDAAKNDQTTAVTDAVVPPIPTSNDPHAPPFTPLDFKIPDQAFQDAKQASEGTPTSFWKYDMYRGPGADGSSDAKVKVHYCTSMQTTERAIRQYFMDEKVLGFDLEWVGNATKHQGPRMNVSLIQLASPSRIGLFHIAAYPKEDKLVAPSLKQLMEDPEVTKVGVCIKGDCTRLSKFLNIEARGLFELSHLYKLVKYTELDMQGSIDRRTVSLATQVQERLGLPLHKGTDVRTSNWARPLHMDQIRYSASDAYAAVQLYATLNHQRQNLDPVPPLPYHAELNLPIRLAEETPPTSSEEESPDVDVAPSDDSTVVEDAVYTEILAIEDVSLDTEPHLNDSANPT